MKKNLFFLTVLVLFSGCLLPSLHPLYTEKTILVNDDIIGVWIDNDIQDYEKSKGFFSTERWEFERFAEQEFRYKGSKQYNLVVNNFMRDTSIINSLNYELYNSQEKNFYALKYFSGGMGKGLFRRPSEKMIMHLTEIGGNLYANFYPWIPDDNNPYEGIAPSSHRFPNLMFGYERFQSNFVKAHSFMKLKLENGQLQMYLFDEEKIENLIKKNRVRLKHEIVNDELVITASTEELRRFVKKFGNNDDLFVEGPLLKLTR